MLNQEIRKTDLINNFVAMMNSDNATLFIGAGLSKSCGLPDWRELMSEPFQAVYGRQLKADDRPDLYDLADKYVQLCQNRVELENMILRNIPENREHYKVSDSHRIIARLPLTSIWTTNWDPIIEKALEEQGKTVTTLKKDTDFPRYSVEDIKLYKVHGCIKDRENLVVTKTDIYTYYRKFEVMNNAFFSRLAEDTFLFIGFSFNDINLKAIIGRLYANYSSSMRPHYAILKQPDSDADRYEFSVTVNDLAKFGIRVYAVKDYSEVNILLKDIERESLRGKVFIGGSNKSIAYINSNSHLGNNYKYNIWPTILADSHYKRKKENQALIALSKCTNQDEIPDKYYLPSEPNVKDFYAFKADYDFPDWKVNDKKHKAFGEFLHQMGEMLIEKNKRIYSGYGEGVCDTVVGGATKKFFSENKDYYKIYNSVRVVPLPAQRDMKDFNSAFYRSYMLGACGFMIITKGSNYSSDYESGTFEEYNIARSLSNTLNNNQRLIMSEINRMFQINYNQHFNYELTNETLKKAIERKKDVQLKLLIASTIERLIREQSKLVFYKYHELYDIFSTLFVEQWKMVLTTLEQVKASLCVFLATRADIDKTIEIKCTDITHKIAKLLLNRSRKLYDQFKFEKEQFPQENYQSEYDGIATDILYIEEIKVTDQYTEQDKRRLLTHLKELLLPLLKAEFKYDYLHSLINGFLILEISYTSDFLNTQANQNDKCKKLEESFNKYEELFIDLIVEITGLYKADYYETSVNSEIVKKCKQELKENKWFNNILNNFNETSDKRDDIRKELRNFLRKYLKGTDFFGDKIDVDLAGQHDFEFYRYRKFLLIYRIQIYKLLEVISDLKIGLRRITSNYRRHIMKKIPDETKRRYKNLFNNQGTEGTITTAADYEENIGDKVFRNTDNIKYNPFIFDPNELEKHINKQESFMDYYERNAAILEKMQAVKRNLGFIYKEVKDLPWDKNFKLQQTLEENIKKTYQSIVENIKKIFEIDARENNSFKSEPYRSATIVIPVATFGGMAKKIWEIDRFRFELIVNRREDYNSDKFNQILSEYYALYENGLKFKNAANNNEETNYKEISKQVMHSIFEIISFFDKPPLEKIVELSN